MSFRKQTPSDFLKQIIGKPVVVKLNSGVDYRGEAEINRLCTGCAFIRMCDRRLINSGVLACLDGYMNIALEQTEEYVNGQVCTLHDV